MASYKHIPDLLTELETSIDKYTNGTETETITNTDSTTTTTRKSSSCQDILRDLLNNLSDNNVELFLEYNGWDTLFNGLTTSCFPVIDVCKIILRLQTLPAASVWLSQNDFDSSVFSFLIDYLVEFNLKVSEVYDVFSFLVKDVTNGCVKINELLEKTSGIGYKELVDLLTDETMYENVFTFLDTLLRHSILTGGKLTDIIVNKLKMAEISQTFNFLSRNVKDNDRVSLFKEAFTQNSSTKNVWFKKISLTVADEIGKRLSSTNDPIRMETVIEEKTRESLIDCVESGAIIFGEYVSTIQDELDVEQVQHDIDETSHQQVMNTIFDLHNTLGVSELRIQELNNGVHSLENGVKDLLVK